jgi:pseudouridine-5'-phosphate glycosidase
MNTFLMETCLLTQGLASVRDDEIFEAWPWKDRPCLVWIEEGNVVVGDIQQYLRLQWRDVEISRISRSKVDAAIDGKRSGPLTASGTLAVAQKLGIGLAVTGGMGGIPKSGKDGRMRDDLPALAELDAALVSTSPKDVVDNSSTIRWFVDNGVPVLGKNTSYCTGFMLNCEHVKLSGSYTGEEVRGRTLLLNGIPEAERLTDLSLLEKAISGGLDAVKQGRPFHPAANATFDSLSGGRSSRLQLKYFIANALWANELADGRRR